MLAHWPVAGSKGSIETHVTTALIVAVLAGAAVSFQGKAAVPAQSASDRIQRHREKRLCPSRLETI